jgi:septum formation protein
MISLLPCLNKNIYLGSQSPRRRQLLTEMGIEYDIVTIADLDEIYPPALDVTAVPEFLSNHKSNALWPLITNADGILITADTIVIVDDVILGKPTDRHEAKIMLSQLSGKTHAVVTGVTIKSNRKITSFSDTTEVTFRELSPTEIDFYIDNYAPFDKAGGYGIQEWIGLVGISEIKGSYFNVVGLPVEKLYKELLAF